MEKNQIKYAVVTPVKDEGRHFEKTLRSMIDQTTPPVCWVIVDDNSSDNTPELIAKYASICPFIRTIKGKGSKIRATGTAEVRAFELGRSNLDDIDYDFIVKLDGDLSFEPDYFERLLQHFGKESALGIASGVYLEQSGSDSSWTMIQMPSYHASGACKVIRRKCFDDIDGFIMERGWDTVDEIRAMTKGWITTHFAELKMKHWKPEGQGMGQIKTTFMHGEIFYRTGGSKLFFLLKVLRRAFNRPFLVGAGAMIWGYLRAWMGGKQMLVSEKEASFYSDLLFKRLISGKDDSLPQTGMVR